MIKTNYHTHAIFCDGSDEPEKYVIQAINKGFISLGFSAHAPLPFETGWNLKKENATAYCEEIIRLKNKYREEIDILLSMEIDFIPDVSESFKNLKELYQLDYVLGAVHLVRSPVDGNIWFIDGPTINFDNGLNQIFNNDVHFAVETYFNQLNLMLDTQEFDIVAHFDKIKMNNKDRFFKETDVWYQKLIRKTLENINSKGIITEVNTRGIYTKKFSDLYPGLSVLSQMAEMKLPITVSADAHKPSDVNKYFEETGKILKDKGFEAIRIYHNNNWVDSDY